MHVAVAEHTKLKQQLERNTVIIKMLEHLKEVRHAWQYIKAAFVDDVILYIFCPEK